MNRDINAILSEDYTQKQFFENSILNSIIIFKNIVLDYFKYFLFYLSPLSRYEFWCFSVFTAVTIIVLFALVSIITITFPASKIYIFTLFYIYVFIVINIAIRVFASRLLSVKMYINHVEQVQNKIPMLAKAEPLLYSHRICDRHIVAITSASQAEDAGSIPVGRSAGPDLSGLCLSVMIIIPFHTIFMLESVHGHSCSRRSRIRRLRVHKIYGRASS